MPLLIMRLAFKSILAYLFQAVIVGPASFVKNTAKELLITLAIMFLIYRGANRLKELDPNLGIPDSSIIVILAGMILLIYVALLISHGVFRLIAPTIAKYADSGDFSKDWEAGTDLTKPVITIAVALLCFVTVLFTLVRVIA